MALGGIVEAVVGVGTNHRIDRLLEFALNPAIDEREFHRRTGRRTHTAIGTFNVHENEARGVPKLRAEVAIAFGALDVEVHIAPERSVGGHREAQRIGAVRGNAVRVVLAQLLFDDRRLFRLTQALRVLDDEGLKVDALNDVERIEGVAFALRHLLAFGVAHETVDVHVLEGDAAREVARHHDHAGTQKKRMS